MYLNQWNSLVLYMLQTDAAEMYVFSGKKKKKKRLKPSLHLNGKGAFSSVEKAASCLKLYSRFVLPFIIISLGLSSFHYHDVSVNERGAFKKIFPKFFFFFLFWFCIFQK